MKKLCLVAMTLAAFAGLSGPAQADMSDASHEAPRHMAVRATVVPDAKKGYNLYLRTRGFRWAPEHVNEEHRRGEGHAHLYIDGVKITRLYGPAFYLGALPAGTHVVRVTLNGNDHGDYVHGADVVDSEVVVTVGATPATPADMSDASHEAPRHMAVRATVVPDAKKGYNLYLRTRGFRWAPEHVNEEHRRGEGHAHLYIDGVKITRLYGPAFYLGALPAGTHVVRVTLNGNDHGDYVHGADVVDSEVVVTVGATPATTMSGVG